MLNYQRVKGSSTPKSPDHSSFYSSGKRSACRSIPDDEVSWVFAASKFKNWYVAMDQYLLIPFLMGLTSIYQLFWCELQGYKVLTHCHMYPRNNKKRVWHVCAINFKYSVNLQDEATDGRWWIKNRARHETVMDRSTPLLDTISNELISFAWENPADVFLK